MAAGDVPVLAPAQPVSGSLRLSLMQRAPGAVRDHAAASCSEQRQRIGPVEPIAGLRSNGPCTSVNKATAGCSNGDSQPAATNRGTHPDSEVGAEDGMDALTVLADAVEFTPQSPPLKPEPDVQLKALPATETTEQQTAVKAEAASGSALGAISALAAIGSAAAVASEVVGPDVDFTLRELEVLTKEVERRARPVSGSGKPFAVRLHRRIGMQPCRIVSEQVVVQVFASHSTSKLYSQIDAA